MMKTIKRGINSGCHGKIIFVNYKIFLVILTMSCLYLFTNPILKIVGIINTVLILILCFFNILRLNLKISKNRIWLMFAVYFCYNIILMIRNFSINSFYSVIVQLGMLFFICSLFELELDNDTYNKIFKFGKFIFMLILIPSMIVLIKGGDSAIRIFDSVFSFTIYKIMFPCSFFILAKSKRIIARIIPISIIFFLIGERSMALCLYIIYAVYFVLRFIKNNKLLYKLLYYVVSVGVIIFPYIYISMQHWPIGKIINEITYQKTGANFFSGRNIVWEIAFDYINKSPFLGYGAGNTVLLDNGITWSTHNLYVYLLLQGGLIGVTIFIVFLETIWMSFFDQLNDKEVRLSAAYLIGIMIFASFELTLIINSINISYFLWMVIAVGLIKSRQNKLTRYD